MTAEGLSAIEFSTQNPFTFAYC